jgi:hypothetical protein
VLQSLNRPQGWNGSEDNWVLIRDRLAKFCKISRDVYFLFAPVRGLPGERVVIHHTYTQRHEPSKLFRDRLRIWFGLRPHVHVLRVSDHLHSQSYHFEFHAPLDQYVFACDAEPLEQSNDNVAPGNKSTVLIPRGGSGARNYAHVYIRGPANARDRSTIPLKVSIDCREKPPGLLGYVATIVTAQAILIWIVGAFHARFFPVEAVTSAPVSHANHIADVASNSPIDVTTLMLALPGVLVTWLGVQFGGERLRSTSLATMMGVIFCGFIAIASTIGAISKSVGGIFGSGFHIAHPVWFIIMIFAVVLACDLVTRTITRSLRFGAHVRAPTLYERKLV